MGISPTVQTYQFGVPSAPSTDNSGGIEAPKLTTRLGGMAYRQSGAGADVSVDGAASANAATGTNGEAGLLGTARGSFSGAKAIADLKPGDRLTTPEGLEVTVEVAEKIGLITKDKDGKYIEGAKAAPAPEKAALEPGQGPQALDGNAETALGEIFDTVSQSTSVGAIMQMVTDGAISRGTLEHAASEHGVTPEEMQAKVARISDGFKAQTDAAMARHGVVDVEAAYAWMREHKSSELRAAMQAQGLSRTTSQYSPLADAYVQSLADHSPATVLNAEFGGGITAHERDGKIILTVPGRGEIEFRTAVRVGAVTVSKARAQ